MRKTQVAKKGEKSIAEGRGRACRVALCGWVGATKGSKVAGGLEQRQKGLDAGGAEAEGKVF